ncbi:MAG: exonuclease domain-containing protein [Candidatus Peribacteraceae bacterium]|nr:exonuclease domain-containing protein [Candidatus Peribacteraceae bacterium]
MKLPSLPFVVLDTETTGFIPKVNRVIEFAAVRYDGEKIGTPYEQLFSIPGSIPAQVSTLTHINDADLEGHPPFEEKLQEIAAAIGEDTLIVGQNVGFDIRMLKGEGIDLTQRPWIDTSMLASLVFPELKSYSLGYVSRVLGLNHEPVHRALGDVHATLELLSRCWERFVSLPAALREPLDAVMAKAPQAYRTLFGALPPPSRTAESPPWLTAEVRRHLHGEGLTGFPLEAPARGTVQLVEEPFTPGFLSQILLDAIGKKHSSAIAVKNLHSTLQSLSIPNGVRVLHPPSAMLDARAVAAFASQGTYTADEATLAVKLAWYEPQIRSQAPLHGEEQSIWNGKLACTTESADYREQFGTQHGVFLLDHRQLLSALAEPKHPGYALLTSVTHAVVDDASMLEDTATKAYGHYCSLNDMRAAAEGNAALTKFTDLLQIWVEKTRQFHDVHYIVPADLSTPEAGGLRSQLQEILEKTAVTNGSPIHAQLASLLAILQAEHLPGRICWIEQRQDGSQFVQSVPEHIPPLLKEHLYDRCSTTLLVPPDSADSLAELLPIGSKTVRISAPAADPPLEISCAAGRTIASIFASPPEGKTVLLMGSRGKIENVFIRYARAMEELGVTLICQNLSGGMGRMQAEFAATTGTTIWVLTPWSFEGVEVPLGGIDHLIIETLPFDHPSHTVLSKRAEHYRDPFNEYTLARLKHRLHRLLRTFCCYRSPVGDILFLDERLEKKEYGRSIWRYLQRLAGTAETPTQSLPEKIRHAPQKVDANKKTQLPLF